VRALATGLGVMGLGLAGSAEAQTMVCASGSTVQGVDVSAGFNAMDWTAAKASGIDFAFMKATQGSGYTDSSFAANWSQTKAAGILRGAYHFFDATVSGVTQANYYLGVVGTIGPDDLPPVLDIECPTGAADCLGNGSSGAASAATIRQVMLDFLTTVKTATGRTPIVYTFLDFFSENSVDTTGFDAYPLWMSYPTSATCFPVPAPWTTAPFWQSAYSSSAGGVGTGADADQFLGTLAQLQAFVGSSAAGDGGMVVTGPFTAPSQVNGNDALSVVSWVDGHIDVFGSKTGGTAAHVFTTGAADTWAAEAPLSGPSACGVASVMWAPSSGHTSEVFAGETNGTTENLEWESSAYTAFAPFGGSGLSHLSTLAYGDGHIEVFALGLDKALWHNVSTQSSWSGWSTMGGTFATGAGPILWTDGHAEIFATDESGTPWHNYTNTASPPVWHGWAALTGGPLASRPIPARWADGHVEVFARGTDNTLYHASETGNVWPAFTTLNPTQKLQGEPSVLVYADYGPEIFSRDTSGNLIHMWNSTGTWSAWANDFGEVLASDPLAWMRPDAVAEVFGVDMSGNLVKSLHSGADWSTFATLGTSFDACVGGTTPVVTPGSDAGSGGGTGVDSGIKLDGGVVGVGDAGVIPHDGGTLPGDFSSVPSGCSCRAAGGQKGGAGGAAGLAIGAALGMRRRRRARG